MEEIIDILDPIIIVISRDQVEARDTSSVIEVFKSFLVSPERARSLFEKVDIAFDGYDDAPIELFEIQKIRDYVELLDDKFPYWLYFMTKEGLGLYCIIQCFLPPCLTKEARRAALPRFLDPLLSNHWFPAMNYLCEATGFSEQQIEELTNGVARYLIEGPRP